MKYCNYLQERYAKRRLMMISNWWYAFSAKEICRKIERGRASESAEGDEVCARLLMIFKDAISTDEGFLFESGDCCHCQLWAGVEEKLTASKSLIALHIELRPFSLPGTLPLILFGNLKLETVWLNFYFKVLQFTCIYSPRSYQYFYIWRWINDYKFYFSS